MDPESLPPNLARIFAEAVWADCTAQSLVQESLKGHFPQKISGPFTVKLSIPIEGWAFDKAGVTTSVKFRYAKISSIAVHPHKTMELHWGAMGGCAAPPAEDQPPSDQWVQAVTQYFQNGEFSHKADAGTVKHIMAKIKGATTKTCIDAECVDAPFVRKVAQDLWNHSVETRELIDQGLQRRWGKPNLSCIVQLIRPARGWIQKHSAPITALSFSAIKITEITFLNTGGLPRIALQWYPIG